MTDQETIRRLDAAEALLDRAEALALSYFRNLDTLTVEWKTSPQDTVSRADREVEELLRDGLGAAFPGDGFLGEELGLSAGDGDWLWVIDPIDGTANFLHGLSEWCISVGLMHRGRVVAGLIAIPCRSERFRADPGQGATLNGQPIRVSGETLQTGITGLGANLDVAPEILGGLVTRLLGEKGMFQRSGSAAVAMAHVACGRLVAYHEYVVRLWDTCAGIALIEAAGGRVHSVHPAADPAMPGPLTAAAPGAAEALIRLAGAGRDAPAPT